MVKVLHICSYYCGSKVHRNLFSSLDLLGVEQTIYTFYHNTYKGEGNHFEGKHTSLIYSPILKPYHRLMYHLKVHHVYKDLKLKVRHMNYNLIHAASLFSDGALAYKLWKEYGIPYVVTVRNTDINEFLGFAPHTWAIGIRVLKHSRKIIFISKAPMEKFCRHIAIRSILKEIQSKFLLQPNGIDDYWIDNVQKGVVNFNHQIIYVGKFDMNKNVIRLIESVLALRVHYPNLQLHLVGGGGNKEKKIMKLVTQYPESLFYHGKIFDKKKLRELYRSCSIFAMPSIHETFGLVYVEALSQNLAVLYTKEQGIDGLFDPSIGESVKALSVESIRSGLQKLIQNRRDYKGYEVIDFEQFRWRNIANKYLLMYYNIISTK